MSGKEKFVNCGGRRTPHPEQHRVALYDGRTALGAVIRVGAVFIVVDAAGAALGTYKSMREAVSPFDWRAP